VKVDGVRAYRRARRGEAVALAARRVDVRELTLLDFAPPDVVFRAAVTAGTYLRSLARDVGERLGCGAHLAALTRTRVGPFRLEDAIAPAAVTAGAVRDPAALVADLARRDLDQVERGLVLHGRTIGSGPGTGEEERVALFSEGRLVAVAERVGDALKPRVVLADA
jgi:tRNA pseudouridine55 synthase